MREDTKKSPDTQHHGDFYEFNQPDSFTFLITGYRIFRYTDIEIRTTFIIQRIKSLFKFSSIIILWWSIGPFPLPNRINYLNNILIKEAAVKFNYFFAGIKQACKISPHNSRASCRLVKSILKVRGHFTGMQNRF